MKLESKHEGKTKKQIQSTSETLFDNVIGDDDLQRWEKSAFFAPTTPTTTRLN